MAKSKITERGAAPQASLKPLANQNPASDEEYLDTDSEVDEFASDHRTGAAELDSDEEGNEGIAQWEADDWDGEGSESDADEQDDDDEDEEPDLRKLQNDLQSLPLATLVKAQRAMGRSGLDREHLSEAGPSRSREDRLREAKAQLAKLQQKKGKAAAVISDEGSDADDSTDESKAKRRARREHKHAPTAMSSKKQVSRSRQVIDVAKKERRDPRFDSMSTGSENPHLSAQAYSFMPQILRDEFGGLKTAVALAQKAERTCKLADKPARTAEREILEMQLGKLRTRIERTERMSRERAVLASAKKEEREKQSQGKGAWYMKKNEKRDLLLKAKFQALEERGGKTAVKKALEKKRTKIAHKEKKSRPFAKGGGGGDAKRRRVE